MKKTLKIINELKKKGLIEDYAIGGGIAAIFYVESFLTYDLDIFIIPSRKERRRNLILLSSIFDYLKNKGYFWSGEHIIIEGIPVQFIPADKLEEEAIRKAKRISYERVKTKVMTSEYLISILLRADRKKDMEKIEKLLQQAKVDMKKLKDILSKYGLSEKIKLL
jgi:predicted nucleotidyltransferase